MTTPEIEELKSLIEQKYGKMLCTTTDFEEFSIYLKQKWCKSISYYHRHQVTKQKEATTEQNLEEDSANHSGNKVMDINFHMSHQNSCVLMPNDKPKTSQKPAEPLR